MRSPTPPPASSHAAAAIVAAAGLVAVAALGAALSLLLGSHAVPSAVLDGLTSAAFFVAPTT
jgi:hypothetical protein